MKKVLVVCLLVLATTRLAAHPTATSFVVIGFSGGTVEVAITTDARALQLKLDALKGSLTDHVDLRIDGLAVPLGIRRTESVADKPGLVRVTLAAAIPAGARTLRWRTSLFLSAYPVAVQAGDVHGIPPEDRDYEWVSGGDSSREYDLNALARPSRWSRFARLIAIGFTHILPGGLDHVLFVLGLTLLSTNLRTVALQISLFTLAHSATLGLAMAGVVSVPSHYVEPLIAVSIAYVALENLFTRSMTYWRLLLVLAFGLLHGLGFAGALRDAGASGGSFASTLFGFNVGVELGQLAVVLAATVLLRLLPWRDAAQQRLVLRPASMAIAVVGLFWAVQRAFTMKG